MRLQLHLNLQQDADKPFVRHFKTKCTASAHLPIWMAVELMSHVAYRVR